MSERPRTVDALPDYAPDGPCVKCGGTDVHTVFHRRSDYYSGCHEKSGLAFGEGEHLCRYCRRCSYQWAEKIMAQPEQAST